MFHKISLFFVFLSTMCFGMEIKQARIGSLASGEIVIFFDKQCMVIDEWHPFYPNFQCDLVDIEILSNLESREGACSR